MPGLFLFKGITSTGFSSALNMKPTESLISIHICILSNWKPGFVTWLRGQWKSFAWFYLCSHNMVTSSCWLDFILKRDLKSKKEIFLKTHLCSSWLSLLASWIHAFEEKASQGLKNFKVPSLVCTHHSISSLIGLDRYWRIKFQTMVLSTFLDDSGA